MTIKQFAEKYDVAYHEVHDGLRKYLNVPTTFEKNVDYDEKLLIDATKVYLYNRLACLFAKEEEIMAKLEHIKERT